MNLELSNYKKQLETQSKTEVKCAKLNIRKEIDFGFRQKTLEQNMTLDSMRQQTDLMKEQNKALETMKQQMAYLNEQLYKQQTPPHYNRPYHTMCHYNLSIFHKNIGKSLKYQLEGTNLAVTRDNKYATILSNTEFIKWTLAEGHFCNLNTGLYHVDTTQWCVTAMFFKDNDRISKYCKLAINNITGPKANYLDQGYWAISLDKSTQMEIKCEEHIHIKTLLPH